MSARIWASTPFCWPRAFRLPSRSFTHAIWAITRWSMVGTRSLAASYQYTRSSSPRTWLSACRVSSWMSLSASTRYSRRDAVLNSSSPAAA